MASTANTLLWHPLPSLEIPKWNEKVDNPPPPLLMEVTVEIISLSPVLLTDADAWLEVHGLLTSGVPLGTITSDRVLTVLRAVVYILNPLAPSSSPV